MQLFLSHSYLYFLRKLFSPDTVFPAFFLKFLLITLYAEVQLLTMTISSYVELERPNHPGLRFKIKHLSPVTILDRRYFLFCYPSNGEHIVNM